MKHKKFIYQLFIFVFTFIFLIYSAACSPNNIVYSAAIYSWGSSGETVKQIQSKLKNQGYYNGDVDGRFGTLTIEAVKYFQKKNGLKVDGIVGEKTLAALGILETDFNAEDNWPSSLPVSTISNKESDIWLLACIINGEGRGEPYLGQVAIGAVVLNRVKHPSFPSTISGVIYQAGAFDAAKDGQISLSPAESCLNAARDAMDGWDPVDGAIYYWNPKTATNEWIQALTVMKVIENHAFAKN